MIFDCRKMKLVEINECMNMLKKPGEHIIHEYVDDFKIILL